MLSFASTKLTQTVPDTSPQLAETELRRPEYHSSSENMPSYESDSSSNNACLEEQKSYQRVQGDRSNPWIVRHYSTDEITFFDALSSDSEVEPSATGHLAYEEQKAAETESRQQPRPACKREGSTRSLYEALSGCRGEGSSTPPICSPYIFPRARLSSSNKSNRSLSAPSPLILSSKESRAAFVIASGATFINQRQAQYLNLGAEQVSPANKIGEEWDFVERIERDGGVEWQQVRYKLGMKGFLRLLQ